MLDRVRAAVEQQRRFTGDASHELRTPIATILVDASLSLECARSAEDHRATISRIESEATRMARIVESLLLLARADAQSAPSSSENVEIRGVLGAAVDRARARATEGRIRIELRAGEGLAVTDRDAGLERVFDNLLDNALRYAPAGSAIEIDATARDGMVRIAVTETPGGGATFVVELPTASRCRERTGG